MVIRYEDADDRSAVRAVNEQAFEHPDEADLIEGVRREGAVLLSLVAVEREQVVGHILFSRMWIDTADQSVAAVALAPVAVLPAHQRRGIGGALIDSGLAHLRDRGEEIVIVLGHPEYYQRFGFSTERAEGLESPFPRHAYMAMELRGGALAGIRGKVRYAAAFGL